MEKLTPIINLSLILLLAWKLAELSWLLVPDGEVSQNGVPAASAVVATAAPERRVDAGQIASWHLFGEARQEPMQKARPVEAPETRLKLTLHGVFASDESREGRAIVSDPRGNAESYGVGDPLPGGAKLSEIYPDRIILERSGRFETLRLPRDRDTGGVSRSPAGRDAVSARAPSGQARAAAFSRYRNEIKRNPASFLTYVRATPARSNGKFVGFTLQPGREPGALKDLGLQPGDIVTAINGVNIDSPAMGIKAMQSLGEGDSVNVTLLRGSEEVSMSLTLPPSSR